MENIAVIAQKRELAEYIKSYLDIFFSRFANVKVYTTEEIKRIDEVKEKVVVISAYAIFKQVETKIRKDALLQTFSQVLSKENVSLLKEANISGQVLLVNVDYYNCMQTIAQLYEAGFQDIDFIPYYGENEDLDREIQIAVTLNELELVPTGIKKVVNIGNRAADIDCIIELAEKLNIKDIFSTPQAEEARNKTALGPSHFNKLFSEAENANKIIDSLIEYMDEGVIVTNLYGKIFTCNQKSRELLNLTELHDNFPVYEILPEIDLTKNHEKAKAFLIKRNEKNLLVSNRRMFYQNSKCGNIITIVNYDEQEDNQYMVRNRIYGSNHRAKSKFSDIVGQSAAIQACIKNAERMAKSDASILITGPSGCGKEIFAQSIHNASTRKRYSFVALNCAAIPENLLESELFGYEKGAFTGANKEGKAGYFELAHKGTIFLDEIGEMPLALQSKLLRVIEERSFARIGSSKLINVDIRIIAATNQNLQKLVDEKQFRQDLFFRLNVLPLQIPSIKERKEDALELLEHFKCINKWDWQLDEETRKFLEEYSWPGNVREIRNVAEYLDNVEGNPVTTEDLPQYMKSSKKDREKVETYENASQKEMTAIDRLRASSHLNFILQEGRNIEIHKCILRVLSVNGDKSHKGRESITEELRDEGFLYSEAEIRDCMKKLSDGGYIKSRRGPGGSWILPRGKDFLQELNMLLG